MIQFNLLPDVKLDYVRTRRTKRIVTMTAGAIAAGSLAIMILLFIAVNFIQKNHLNNLSADIARDTKTLQETPNLDKVLTVQNQLNSLSSLHSQKPQLTRLNTYLQQITPANTSIAELEIDFSSSSIKISGSAENLATVNKFIDTLKFTNYKYDDVKALAFKDVVLSSFALGTNDKASFQISLGFDTLIFDSSKAVTLEVPNTVTTRSSTDKPLFENLSVPLGGQ